MRRKRGLTRARLRLIQRYADSRRYESVRAAIDAYIADGRLPAWVATLEVLSATRGTEAS